MDPAGLIDALDATWASTSEALHGIDRDAWDGGTGCPGWSVRDQLSHLVWAADLWRGVPPEVIEVPPLAHVHGPVGEYMELAVHARRDTDGEAVLAEFDASRAAAIADLRSRLPDGLDEPMAGPMGHELPRSAFLTISVYDQWVHGHDIRMALGLPADRSSAAAAHAVHQMLAGWSARLEGGTPVAVRVLDHEHVLGDGDPVATITMSWSDFVTRATGRDRSVDEATVTGDRAAAERALDLLPVTP